MYFIVLLLLFVVKFCYSDKNIKPDGAVLNINRRRPEGIVVLRQHIYNIDTLVYTAIDGYISDVIDDRGIIWKDNNRNLKFSKVIKFRKETKLLHIQSISNDNTSIVKYFYRIGRVWNEINSERFYDVFELQRSEASFVTELTVYLKGNTSEKKSRVNRPADSRFAAYAPNYGYRVNKVCYRNLGVMCFKSLWASESHDQHCLFVSVHSRDKPRLAYLIISDAGRIVEKFYYKPGYFKSWTVVDEDEYMKRLKERDIDIDKINVVELDLNNIDTSKFYFSEFGYKGSACATYPKPGFRLTKVSFGDKLIWECSSPEHFCYSAALFSYDGNPKLCYLLISEGRDRRIDYYHFENDTWVKVDKKLFYHKLAKKDDPRYTHRNEGVDAEGNRQIEMSYFKNRQGMMIKTYRAMVPNHKGNVVLIHGFGIHFLSTFLRYDIDWNYNNFGFTNHPYLVCPDPDFFYDFKQLYHDRFRHVFEYNFYDKVYPLKQMPMFQYEGGIAESLNNMGYSVYGMDIQSHGFSEGIDSIRSHVNSYNDYIEDLIQFIYIIKRHKFLDTNQVWSKSLFSKDIEFDDKIVLFGYSLGANISFRAIQEHNKKYKSNDNLVDGFVSLSGMFDLYSNISNVLQKIYIFFFPLFAALVPRNENLYQQYPNYGQRFNFVLFLNDDKYGPHFCTWRTINSLYQACRDVGKNMKFFPNNIPSLFLHSKDDYKCIIKGVRKLVEKLGLNARLVESPGKDHHTFETDYVDAISRHFAHWFDKIVKKEPIILS